MKAIASFIWGLLPFGGVDRFGVIAPFNQAAGEGGRMGVTEASGTAGRRKPGVERGGWDIGPHVNDPLSAALQPPEDRRLRFSQSASVGFAVEPAAAAAAADNRFRLAFVTGNQGDLIPLDRTFPAKGLFFATPPLRTGGVRGGTSVRFSPSSCALCCLDSFRPLRSRHTPQIFSG